MKIKNEFIKWAKGFGQEVKAADLDVEGTDVTLWTETEKVFFNYLGNGEFDCVGSKDY